MGFDVVITAFPNSTAAASLLEDMLGLEPSEARSLVQSVPCAVIRGTTQVHANIAAEQLREAGATVEILDRAAPPPEPPSAVPAQRHLFDTVALRGIEHDLAQIDPNALPRFEEPRVTQPAAPSWDAPLDDSPLVSGSAARRLSRELPDVDAFLAGQGDPALRRAEKPKAKPSQELDDLFRAPAPVGAENYFKRPAEERPHAAMSRQRTPGNEATGSENPPAAKQETLLAVVAKVAGAVVALALVAGALIASWKHIKTAKSQLPRQIDAAPKAEVKALQSDE